MEVLTQKLSQSVCESGPKQNPPPTQVRAIHTSALHTTEEPIRVTLHLAWQGKGNGLYSRKNAYQLNLQKLPVEEAAILLTQSPMKDQNE